MSNLKKVDYMLFIGSFKELTEFHKHGNDPLPDLRSRSQIESLLNYPFQVIFGRVAFWGFYNKAACYFYTFSKGHALANGNKRAGVMVVNLFYDLNGRTLNISEKKMYDLSKWVANSDALQKDNVIKTIANTLKNYK